MSRSHSFRVFLRMSLLVISGFVTSYEAPSEAVRDQRMTIMYVLCVRKNAQRGERVENMMLSVERRVVGLACF